MKNGYLRVAAVSPRLNVADVKGNVDKIIAAIDIMESKEVEIAVFPELCITGYTCGDLFHNTLLLDAASEGLERIREHLDGRSIDVIVGLPVRMEQAVYNCAAYISGGVVKYVSKRYIPNYNEFYERRWFAPGEEMAPMTFESHGARIGVEICEDLWVTVPPSSLMSLAGAEVIFNLSASDDVIGKHRYLQQLICQQSARCMCGYVYASAGEGESTTDLVFFPKTIIAENGSILAENDRFEVSELHYSIADIDLDALRRDRMHTTTFADCAREFGIDSVPVLSAGEFDPEYLPEYRNVDPYPFVPSNDDALEERCREIISIQEAGLARRLTAIGCSKIVVGISGGLDSTLALLIAVKTFDRMGLDRKGIIAVTMPGFGTTDRTYNNAQALMAELGVTVREIPIAPAVLQHFKDIDHDVNNHDVTYENSQARERTQLLMDISNQVGGIVLGTGDLSELALGWATYNGDHMSMYGVNAGVPKTLVRFLVKWFAMRAESEEIKATLLDVIDTPISPELTPADSEGKIAQKTEELVGPYELSDFYLYYMLRYGFTPERVLMLARKAFGDKYDTATLIHWMDRFYSRFFSQQFKRSCLPDGPKVGSVCLSPRGDWRMPSDASRALWMNSVARLRELFKTVQD